MRLLLTLLFCLKCGYPATAQQQAVVLGQMRLRLYFDPFYNRFEKACCKMYPSSGCRIFLNNKGYVDNYYKGRILLREFNGGMEVTVWNLQRDDAGYYRCSVFQPTGNSIFQDYVIEIVDTVSQLSPPTTPSQPPSHGTTLTATIRPLSTSVETPAVLSDIKEEPRFTWKVVLLVAAGFTLVLLIAMSAIIMAFRHHRKRGKGKDKETPSGPGDSILPHIYEEEAPIIYTEVDFKPHGDKNDLHANDVYGNDFYGNDLYGNDVYANVLQSPRAPRAKPPAESLDTVEYSTVVRSL